MATATKRRSAPSRRKSGRTKKRDGAKLFILTSLLLITSALVLTVGILAWKASHEGMGGLAEGAPLPERPVEEWPEDGPVEGPLPSERPSPSEPPSASTRPTALPVAPGEAFPAGHERPGPERGSLVVVIDDVGMNLEQLEPFLRFPGPLTFAVLPGLPYSKAAAQRIGAAGKELILHQPMEAEGGQNTGPGAILSSMNEFEVLAVLSSNIAALPGVRGLNNHMGSKGTQDIALMRTVLGFARERGLFFLDSRTTTKTQAPLAAQEAQIELWERDVFLDNESDRESQERKLREGMGIAQRKGRAVMIGHVWSAELAQLLMDMYPELVEEGYSLTSISRLMRGMDDAGPGD